MTRTRAWRKSSNGVREKSEAATAEAVGGAPSTRSFPGASRDASGFLGCDNSWHEPPLMGRAAVEDHYDGLVRCSSPCSKCSLERLMSLLDVSVFVPASGRVRIGSTPARLRAEFA